VESPSHTNVVGGFNAPTRNGLLDARRSRRATRTSASDQRRTAISEVVFPGPAANCPVWGKIGAIADGASSPSGQAHRHHRPVLVACTQIAPKELTRAVHTRSGYVGQEAGRGAKRTFNEPRRDFVGFDGLEPDAGRDRYYGEPRHLLGHREDEVIKLCGA